MITDSTLACVRDKMMDAMVLLYCEDRDDEIAKDLAGAIVMIHDAIELELLERMMSR